MFRLSRAFNASRIVTKISRCQCMPKPYARSIWTTRTTVTEKHEDLLEALPSSQEAQDSNIAMFTVSRNVPQSSLSKLVKHFQDFPSKAIGCLAYGHEDGSGPYSLSYAIHKSSDAQLELVVPFRSDITGVPKISLGREVSRKEKKVYDAEWASGDDSIMAEGLPEELQNLDSSMVSQVVYFSDEQAQGLMKSLDTHLPEAEKLGLLASSTPFVTGRPYTIMYGSEIHSSGAVGVAVCRRPASSRSLAIDYGGLKPLGGPLEVTISKGNIILQLASTNATKLLLERIQQGISTVIDKEQGFYLGILPEGKVQASLKEMVSVRPILAGDPSRGALSLDTEANIKPGQYVQFLHDAADTKEHTHSVRVNDASSLIFSETSAGHSSSLGPHASFLGSSEHGYVVGRPKQSSWICSVTGSSAKLAL